jgi:hypothetical protein
MRCARAVELRLGHASWGGVVFPSTNPKALRIQAFLWMHELRNLLPDGNRRRGRRQRRGSACWAFLLTRWSW